MKKPALVRVPKNLVKCRHCAWRWREKKGAPLCVNDCMKVKITTFFTDIPRRCRYYKNAMF